MARLDSKSIIIRRDNRLYRFVNCKLEPNDGSFYVSFLRDGESDDSFIFDSINMKPESVIHESPRKKLKRISYHASGCAIYHNTEIGSNYFEPISNLTQANEFAVWSIPSLEHLEEITAENEDDYVVDLFDQSGRVDFHFTLAPWNIDVKDEHIAVRYEGLFSLIIIPIKPQYEIPPEVMQCFIVMAPNCGLFQSQVLNDDQALINYHQKLNKTKDLIIYSPNKAGIYTVITSVPMRVTPRINVTFLDDSLRIEPVGKGKNNVVKFKVKDSNDHYVKVEQQIHSIELDSEIY